MQTICSAFDWKIGDRVHILQKHNDCLMVALNGATHLLSVNNPIGRRLYGWPVDTMLVVVGKCKTTYNQEGKHTAPWNDDCIGKTNIPVYVRVSL